MRRSTRFVLAGSLAACSVPSERFTSAGTPNDTADAPPIGPLLSVIVAGSGAVTASGIACPGDCTEALAEGTSIELTATPAAGATLIGWMEPCTGVGPTCDVSVAEPVAIAASFSAILDFVDRYITYTNISIDGGGGAAIAAPGSTVTLMYNITVAFDSATGYCPGCVVQSYIGIGGTSQTLQCESSISNGYTASYHSGTFTAPTTPGTYYLTQTGTLDFSCLPRDFPNDWKHSIAVLEVRSP